MRKRMLLITVISLLCITAHAQHAVSSLNWQIIGTFTYKLQNNKYIISFPPPLKALDNKIIELPGYMIPTKVGKEHKEFMFSVLPVQQCAFCGSGDYPPMILVNTVKPVPYAENVMTLKGKFILNTTGNNQPEFSLINAAVVQP